ncbi:amidohydrolase family protein [Ruania zhangjianzhongii]|uniref:amidohydrolase family protein n=1 Tax=Ruania zhangjianzhongii TaxID=2603206 RepID=UPI0011CA6D9B|nr:hypothetical protein [Ruania zhangjianzhongii]
MSDPLESFATQQAVDVTAFLGLFPWRLQAHADAAALTRQADRLGLSGLCLSHLASVFGYDTRSGNEELHRVVEAEPRFSFTPILNPTEPGWQAELAWALGHGARGVRIVPGYHGYTLGHPAAADLVAAVQDAGIALHLSTTLEDPRERHPRYIVEECTTSQIADFLRLAQPVPIVLSGLRSGDWTEVRANLDAGHDLRRVLLDTWRMNGPIGVLRTMCETPLASMLAYGTCQPVQEPVASAYQLATATIDDAARQALAAQNARRVLPGLPE